ncbi:hypothetical protein RRSWK_02999 [Rhodopirellula sp. SWK7]|nr:hypothetical protein RRSWK_02999 [Rhodopirellula sp. SWK7]
MYLSSEGVILSRKRQRVSRLQVNGPVIQFAGSMDRSCRWEPVRAGKSASRQSPRIAPAIDQINSF